MFTIDHSTGVSLVTQIVAGVTRLAETQALRPGMKMPSIRQFANTHSVSLFTVVEAYDRLVARGVLLSRPNAGFFVRKRSLTQVELDNTASRGVHFDSTWYMRSIFESHRLPMRPGCGWLPHSWLFEDGLRRGLRRLASAPIDLAGYGDPKGYLPLRKLVSQTLLDRNISAGEDQVLLTQGSSQALDLAARRLVRPGDVVLVDEPGYANLLHILRFMGATLIGAPRVPEGYDLAALEQAISAHRPKVMFTQPRLQSPTGSCAHAGHLHRLLQLAERHDLLIVENDIYADLDPELRPSLASLDQISRVVHIGSFSKTVSPNLRVGYLVAPSDMVSDLAQLKMLGGLTTPEFSERIAHEAVTDARWRRHLKSLRSRLTSEHERVAARLLGLGFELFTEAEGGLFLWARHPSCADSSELSTKATQNGILLGPGQLFSTSEAVSPWLRFNVPYCDDERIFQFLQRELAS